MPPVVLVMSYQWVKFIHVASAIAFVGVHGASILVLYAVRRERDRQHLLAVLDFSSRTVTATYASLVAVVGTGFWLGFERDTFFGEGWFWLSLVLLALTTVLMWAVAKPFTRRIRTACEVRPSGVPRTSDEELSEILQSSKTHLITLIGVVGLGSIIYLMLFQPKLWAEAGPPTPTTSPSTSTTTMVPGGVTTTSPDASPTTTMPGSDDPLLALGKEVFEVTAGGLGCAFCHGSDGLGTVYGPRIAGRSKEDISNALRWADGMTDITLTPDELEGVARYVRTLP
jgi:uncharacterized membrane protein/cytochrome c553